MGGGGGGGEGGEALERRWWWRGGEGKGGDVVGEGGRSITVSFSVGYGSSVKCGWGV